jgi:membrane dipeptidase
MNISDQARALHDQAIIIDGHNDSIIEHWARSESMLLGPDLPTYQVDLPRMRAGGLTAMFSMVGGGELFQCVELWDGMHANVAEFAHDFAIIHAAEDINACKQANQIGLIGQLESCTALGRSLRVLRVFHTLGVRVAGLTHGEADADSLHGTRSPFDYCIQADRDAARKDFIGLTDFGREAIPEMNRLGVVVDLAHTQDASYFEAIALSTAPVVFSHGNVFACCPHWRNLTDDQLRALKDSGGAIGIAFYPRFIDQDPAQQTISRLVDHIEYVCDFIGDDHIAFGADYDGMGEAIAVPPSYADLPLLTQAMLDRGFPQETILKFWGGNPLSSIA